MSNPIIKIHNIQTDEVVEREMTDDEAAKYFEAQQIQADNKLAEEAQLAAKDAAFAKLAALGLTVDDLTALGL